MLRSSTSSVAQPQQWRAPGPATLCRHGLPPRLPRRTVEAAASGGPELEVGVDEAAASCAAERSSAAGGAAQPPASTLDGIEPQRLKQLRRDGLALKDTIKIGRRGPAAEGLVAQVRQRWNTSEVARLYCHGKHAANMKLVEQQLEEATGGLVVHRAGGTVLLYRGDAWQQPLPVEQQQQLLPAHQEQRQEERGGDVQQRQQQQQACDGPLTG